MSPPKSLLGRVSSTAEKRKRNRERQRRCRKKRKTSAARPLFTAASSSEDEGTTVERLFEQKNEPTEFQEALAKLQQQRRAHEAQEGFYKGVPPPEKDSGELQEFYL